MNPMLLAAVVAATIPTTTIYDGNPPPRYQGDNAAVVFFVDNVNTPERCGVPPSGYVFLGCQKGNIMMVTNPCRLNGIPHSYEQILCHELGHRNGWPNTHGN